jgi:hypothetical protein
MAPTIRIGWSSRTPMPAIRVAIDRKTQERGRERRLLARALLHLLPHDGVDALSGCVELSLPGNAGQRGVDLLDRDRSVLLDPEGDELVDEMVGGLPGDIAHHDVAGRFPRGAGQHDHARNADRVGEQRANRVRAVRR